jgi:molybdopterin-guanine dinucleotide biosynthesis protein A
VIEVGGRRIIDRVAEVLREASDQLLLIANDEQAGDWLPGVRVERDVREGLGSLGGIYSALFHADGPVLLVAWDMPFVPAGLLRALRAAGADADAVLPESGSKRGVEPMCAYYSMRCLGPVGQRLDAGERRVISFLDAVRFTQLSAREVARFGDPERIFMNVNSPDELALAEAHAAAADGRRDRQEE